MTSFALIIKLLLQMYLTCFPRNIQEALDDQNWKLTVLEEMNALENNKTREIVDLPKGKKIVGCRWLFNIKCKAYESAE